MDRDNDPAAKTDLQEPVDGGEDESFQEIMQLAHEPNPPRQLDLEIPTLQNQPRPQPQIFSDGFQDPTSSQFAVENDDQAAETDLQEPVDNEEENLPNTLTRVPIIDERSMQPHQDPPQPLADRALSGPILPGTRPRRPSEKNSAPKNGILIIAAPFPWATNRRAIVHDLKTLADRGIREVSGEVCCSCCRKQFTVSYNIMDEFSKLRAFVEAGIREEKSSARAPERWMKPVLADCESCGQKKCMKPVISVKKRGINWLFLLLGWYLGLCTKKQLKFFCKHTLIHRSGAKNRAVYVVYLGLLKQLDETGPFHALS